MAKRLTPVSRKEFIKRLRALGFDGPYAGGNSETGHNGLTVAEGADGYKGGGEGSCGIMFVPARNRQETDYACTVY